MGEAVRLRWVIDLFFSSFCVASEDYPWRVLGLLLLGGGLAFGGLAFALFIEAGQRAVQSWRGFLGLRQSWGLLVRVTG